VYDWIEHTGELELFITAAHQPEVFADALTAFAELVGDEGAHDSVRRELELEAPDVDELLVDWLEELVYLADAEAFVPENLVELDLEGGRLHAVVQGHHGEPRPLVKAVTRHGLEFEPVEDGGWHARVVLDV
jgi:SHS2 domain-containing protein